jgi:hypothetical protein
MSPSDTAKFAIERVEAAAVEMERAIAGLREVDARHDMTISERREIAAAHNRARRSVA